MSQPCALAADSAHLYWLDCTDDTLSSLPLSGLTTGTPAVLAMSLDLGGVNAIPALAVAGGSAFWIASGSGAIQKVATTGGTPVTLVPATSLTPTQIVTDGTDVYWLSGLTSATVSRVSAAGGAVTQVLSGSQNQNGGYGYLGLDASYLYFWDNDDATVRRLAR